jgi:hypothetical protein
MAARSGNGVTKCTIKKKACANQCVAILNYHDTYEVKLQPVHRILLRYL